MTIVDVTNALVVCPLSANGGDVGQMGKTKPPTWGHVFLYQSCERDAYWLRL
jgi:hypothetical protein